MYNSIKSLQASLNFQQDINKLCSWSNTWQLHFNADKCKIMHLGYANDNRGYTMLSKENTTVALATTDVEKDLGVYVDDKLKFHDHVDMAVKKANCIIGVIKRNFKNMGEDSLCQLYKSLVRPRLEYGNTVWHPRFKKDDVAIERVQRRATKLIPTLKALGYGERLRRLNLPSMWYRRKRGDMIEVYKFLTGVYSTDSDVIFRLNANSKTRGHSLKLYKHSSRLDVRKFSFGFRTVTAWNSLPEEVVTAENVNIFKNKLDKIWINHKYTFTNEDT